MSATYRIPRKPPSGYHAFAGVEHASRIHNLEQQPLEHSSLLQQGDKSTVFNLEEQPFDHNAELRGEQDNVPYDLLQQTVPRSNPTQQEYEQQ